MLLICGLQQSVSGSAGNKCQRTTTFFTIVSKKAMVTLRWETGHYGHTGFYTKTLSGLDAGSYTLTYWQKSGSPGRWLVCLVTVTGGTYTIGASPAINAQIDDVRFYPSTAQMNHVHLRPVNRNDQAVRMQR